MAQSRFKKPDFLELFKEWNQILEETGFKDAENFSLEGEPLLKCWHSQKWNNNEDKRKVEETLNYLSLASNLLKDFPFESDTHKKIWELHCEGISSRKIAAFLNKKDFTKSPVHAIIVEIRKKSGLKK